MAIFLTNNRLTWRSSKAHTDHKFTLPSSVIEMLMGFVGAPEGGWPKRLQKIILRGATPQRGRPRAHGRFFAKVASRCERGGRLNEQRSAQAVADEVLSYLSIPMFRGSSLENRNALRRCE